MPPCSTWQPCICIGPVHVSGTSSNTFPSKLDTRLAADSCLARGGFANHDFVHTSAALLTGFRHSEAQVAANTTRKSAYGPSDQPQRRGELEWFAKVLGSVSKPMLQQRAGSRRAVRMLATLTVSHALTQQHPTPLAGGARRALTAAAAHTPPRCTISV